MVQIIVFLALLLLGWTFAFMTGVRYTFRKEYRKYREILFESGKNKKPHDWGISRPGNYSLFWLCFWLAVIFLLLATACGIAIHDIEIVLMLTVAIPCAAFLPIGLLLGKDICRRSVQKQCNIFGIEFEEIKDSDLQKKSSGISWRFFFICIKFSKP